VFAAVLREIRDRIRARQYVVTLHAEEEMAEDELSPDDLEQGLLTGSIVERQQDKYTGEWKYRIRGSTINGEELEIVCKHGATGCVVVITIYRC